MHREPHLNLQLAFFIAISVFGLAAVLMFILVPTGSQEDFALRKPLVGTLFTLICAGGIAAAFFPNRCTRISAPVGKQTLSRVSANKAVSKGHHPACKKFESHVIRLNGSFLCAACTGLCVGAVIASAGGILSFFAGASLGPFGFPAVVLGEIGIIAGFLQFKTKGLIRSLMNCFFVLGASLVLIGAEAISADVLVDLYVICLMVFWLWTRIMISKWRNSGICRACDFCVLEGT